MKWWEKTVEYKFVLDHVIKNSFISPLAGHEERAGDVVFGQSERLLLIEFKKDSDALSTEYEKFTDYKMAETNLDQYDKHHLLIFGAIEMSVFNLKVHTYFSRKSLSFQDALSSGLGLGDFKAYLSAMLSYKKDSKKGSSSSGGGTVIAGVNAQGKVIGVMSSDDFISQHLPTQVPKFEPPRPSPGDYPRP